MKKQIAITSAIIAATSFSNAEIALTESLSVEGFIDMSWSDLEGAGNNSEVGIDQVEFDFLFSSGAVSAQVDVEYEEGEEGTNIEQAFVSYDLGNSGAITAGRMASQLGFEDFEPTGLYQVSNAISTSNLPGYDQGIKYTNGSLGVAIVDGVNDNRIADNGGYSIEAAYSLELSEGLNGFLGARLNSQDGVEDTSVYNMYVTYETGAWLFAAEVAQYNGATSADDATDYQVMANYSYSDTASITLRYATNELDTLDTSTVPSPVETPAGSAITVAHNLALADNLALIAELTSFEPDAAGADDVLGGAVELLFTF